MRKSNQCEKGVFSSGSHYHSPSPSSILGPKWFPRKDLLRDPSLDYVTQLILAPKGRRHNVGSKERGREGEEKEEEREGKDAGREAVKESRTTDGPCYDSRPRPLLRVGLKPRDLESVSNCYPPYSNVPGSRGHKRIFEFFFGGHSPSHWVTPHTQ